MSPADGDPVIRTLLLQQMAPWLGAVIDRGMAEETYHALNRSVRSVFLYRIGDGAVDLLEKPGFRLRDTFNDSSEPEPEGPVIYREEFIRAHMYRDFFARILAGSDRTIDMLIAIDVNDKPIEMADAPAFAFQKPAGSNTVLIPDVDFLHSNFYIPVEYRDDTPYAAKFPWAIFAGSTTAGRTITASDVETLSIPRLRAGIHFKASRQVDFRIPHIVQCESPAVVSMVAGLGINAERCDWRQQFKYRFILSMDGNGATCSRVVIGLASNSALAKYDSPHLLYYFGALVPWRHYIPISRDEDVPAIVEAERRHPMMFAGVAAEGRSFAQRYLGRAGTCGYGAGLLSLLQSCLSGSVARGPAAGTAVQAPPLQLVEVGAHIQGIGDVWGWPGEWVGGIDSGRAIEAIAVVPTGVPLEAIDCRVILSDGSLSGAGDPGGFCGTRGDDAPLHGFALRFNGAWSSTLACTYSGHFLDGTRIGPLQAGEVCQAPSGAALVAFHVSVWETVAPVAGDPDMAGIMPNKQLKVSKDAA